MRSLSDRTSGEEPSAWGRSCCMGPQGYTRPRRTLRWRNEALAGPPLPHGLRRNHRPRLRRRLRSGRPLAVLLVVLVVDIVVGNDHGIVERHDLGFERDDDVRLERRDDVVVRI